MRASVAARPAALASRALFSTSVRRLNAEDPAKKPAHSHTHGGKPCSGHSHAPQNGAEPLKMDHPMLLLSFTCKKCDTRSSHMMSKQAYNHGSILVQCPGCKVRHLIADHLGIFSDNKITIEDIMNAQGQTISNREGDLVWEHIPEGLRELVKSRVNPRNEQEEQDKQSSASASDEDADVLKLK